MGISFKKLGLKSAYDPAIPLLDMYPEETKIEKDTCSPVFTAALFTIAIKNLPAIQETLVQSLG